MSFSLFNILLTFGTGILSVASPCILPIIPVIVSGTNKDSRFRPLFIVAGLSLTFILMGIITSAFSYLVLGRIYYLEKIAGVMIAFFGITLFFNFNPFKNVTVFNRLSRNHGKGNISGFFLGATLGLIWIPCIGPLLSGILAMVAAQNTIRAGAVFLSIYALGFSVPIVLAGYFSQFFRSRTGVFRSHPAIIRFASGVILLLMGGYIFFKGMVGFTF